MQRFILLVICLLIGPVYVLATAGHPHDTYGTAKQRDIYTTPELDSFSIYSAIAEQNALCFPIAQVKDAFETFQTPEFPGSKPLTITITEVATTLNLVVEVWDSNLNTDTCFYMGHQDVSSSFMVQGGETYYVRYYHYNPAALGQGNFSTAYSADFGMAKCPSGDITLTTQDQVDSLLHLYPTCTTIHGNLVIADVGTSITHLDSLHPINRIKGRLEINTNYLLRNLHGLHNLAQIDQGFYLVYSRLTNIEDLTSLRHIGGEVSLIGNLILKDSTDLAQLNTVEGRINIWANNELVDLRFLKNIDTVSNNLYLNGNPKLASLAGLEELTYVGQNFKIENCDMLTDLDPLGALSHIGATFSIVGNLRLKELDSLHNLNYIGGHVTINSNASLKYLDGLEGLSSLGGNLDISNNESLRNFDGLDYVTSLGGMLYIKDNRKLEHILGLSSIDSIQGFLKIDNNDKLASLEGLNNIDPTTIENSIHGQADLMVENNALLSHCEIETICGILDLPEKDIVIKLNDGSCTSISDIDNICQAILPVELFSFDINESGAGVVLSWATATESNNLGFHIERKREGGLWELIGWQDGAGNSPITNKYEFTDPDPGSGLLYYRLVQEDYDGELQNLATKHILIKMSGNQSVYPNPTSDRLHWAEAQAYTLRSLDGTILASGHSNNLDISNQASGIYLLNLNDRTHKVVKW